MGGNSVTVLEKIIPNKEMRRWFLYAVSRRAFSLLVNLLLIASGVPKVGIAAMLIFTGFFYALRQYIGGYHADSPVKCVICSLAQTIFCVYLLFPTMRRLAIFWSTANVCICIGTVYILAPLLPKQLGVSRDILPLYRKKALWIAFIEMLIIVFLIIIGRQRIALCGSLGMGCAAFSLLIKKHLQKKEE